MKIYLQEKEIKEEKGKHYLEVKLSSILKLVFVGSVIIESFLLIILMSLVGWLSTI